MATTPTPTVSPNPNPQWIFQVTPTWSFRFTGPLNIFKRTALAIAGIKTTLAPEKKKETL